MSWPGRIPLFFWLVASVAIVIAATVTLLTWLDIRADRASANERAESIAHRTALMVVSQIDDLVVAGDVDGIREFAQSLGAIDKSASLEVLDSEGRIMVQAGAKKWGQTALPDDAAPFPDGAMVGQTGSLTVASLPISVGGRTLGEARVLVDSSALQRSTADLARDRIVTSVVVAALGILGAAGITYWLTAPMNRAARALQSFDELDERSQLPVGGPMESRKLIGSLNQAVLRVFARDREREAQSRERLDSTTRQMVTPLNLAMTYAEAIREAKSSTAVSKQVDNLQSIHERLSELIEELQKPDEAGATEDGDAARRAGADSGARSSGGGG